MEKVIFLQIVQKMEFESYWDTSNFMKSKLGGLGWSNGDSFCIFGVVGRRVP